MDPAVFLTLFKIAAHDLYAKCKDAGLYRAFIKCIFNKLFQNVKT